MLGSLSPLLTLNHPCSPTAETPPCSHDFLAWKQPGTKVFYLFVTSAEIPPDRKKHKWPQQRLIFLPLPALSSKWRCLTQMFDPGKPESAFSNESDLPVGLGVMIFLFSCKAWQTRQGCLEYPSPLLPQAPGVLSLLLPADVRGNMVPLIWLRDFPWFPAAITHKKSM